MRETGALASHAPSESALSPAAAKTTACRVCVVGLGHIGLPTAAVLASRGFTVHGVEVDPGARETINAGQPRFVEPDLGRLVQAGVASGLLRAHGEPAPADVFVICVPTPLGESKRANLDHVRAAASSIAAHVAEGNLVVLESTCPPGTTEMVAALVAERGGFEPGQVHFAHAPERVLPGRILAEVVEGSRVIGGLDDASTEAACRFYASFVRGRITRSSCRTVEMAKLVENASRDVQIAFANEVSMLCEEQGIDARELIDIANLHPRVNILEPGCGVGGHCIAVDPWFLVGLGGEDARLIRTAREVNDRRPGWVVERVLAATAGLTRPVVACLGAAYKGNIDDLRGSPALEVARGLMAAQQVGRVLVVEPNVRGIGGVDQVDLAEALGLADVLVLLVPHDEFRGLDLAELTRSKVVLDVCGATRARTTRGLPTP